MDYKEIKQKLALTEEQKAALEEFVSATRKLKDAGVLVIENRYAGDIIFVNGNEVESHWVGSDESEAPEQYDFFQDKLYSNDIDDNALGFDQLFDNYFLPEEFMLVKFKL